MGSAQGVQTHLHVHHDIDDVALLRKLEQEASTEAVETFSKLAFEMSNNMEAVNALIRSESGRRAFADFLDTEKIHGSLRNVKLGSFRENSMEEKIDMTYRIITNYGIPRAEIEADSRLTSFVSASFEHDPIQNDYQSSGEYNDMDIVLLPIVAINLFPKFILSKFYRAWRKSELKELNEIAHKSEKLQEEILNNMEENSSTSKIISDEDIIVFLMDTLSSSNSCASSAFSCMEKVERHKILLSGSWLTILIAALEALPICVSLSTASKSRPGFPLIYVNKQFELTTGYSRNEIIGENCKFLQRSHETSVEVEQDKIALLSTALRENKPVRVSLTNFKKDGTPFHNLLALKPVFDAEGEYAYVIGVQFDLSNNMSYASALIMADRLIDVLPDRVVTSAVFDSSFSRTIRSKCK